MRRKTLKGVGGRNIRMLPKKPQGIFKKQGIAQKIVEGNTSGVGEKNPRGD